MKFGSMKGLLLTRAKDIFLFDCRVAGFDPRLMRAYHEVLTSFIRFTGEILVEELTPDHVRLYIANLSDGPHEGQEHIRLAMNHYTVIHTWIRWLFAQKFIIEHPNGMVKPPRLTNLFPSHLNNEELDSLPGVMPRPN